jgi:serine protease Do
MGVQRQELGEDGRPRPQQPLPPRPQPERRPPGPPERRPPGPPERRLPTPPEPAEAKQSPANQFYEPKPGFANFYFNRLERDRLWAGFRRHGDLSAAVGTWTIDGEFEINQKKSPAKVTVSEEMLGDGKSSRTTVRLNLGGVGFKVDPLKGGQEPQDLTEPPGSGGLLMALYHYRRLMTLGEKGFEGQFAHGGQEPFYPPAAADAPPLGLNQLRVDTEVLTTEHAAIPAKWYFARTDQTLLGAEVTVVKDEDPCELYFSDYRSEDGNALPYRVEIRHGNGRFGILWIKSYQFATAK